MSKIKMVDIGNKAIVKRIAIAEGKIKLKESTIRAIKEQKIKKGDPLDIATTAGLTGAKRTSDLIPLCHPIPITNIDISFRLGLTTITARCEVKAEYKTGVEMEALVGVTNSLLTIWDMTKYLEKDKEGQYPGTRIYGIRVVRKEKGNKKDLQ
jgi:cyclic pyranopterin phosphate synthase